MKNKPIPNHRDHSKHERSETHKKHEHEGHGLMINDLKKRFWVSLIVTVPLLALAPMIQKFLRFDLRFVGDRYLQFGLASLVFFYGGWPFLKGLRDEIKDKSPGMMTLIALAISVAYFYSSAVIFGLGGKIFFWELVTLIDIMLLGHWLEMKSTMRASNALEELVKLMPSEAHLVTESGETKEVQISELKKDDIILVKPGEKIPADGVIKEGESNLNESMLTGESKPVHKKLGDEIIGGSINGEGSLKIAVKHTEKDSYLFKVIEMVKKAQSTKSKTQNLANRAAGWLFYIALGCGILTLIIWLFIGKDFEYALERMVTVMVISCPHALGLAVPLVAAISTTVAANNGLLIRNRTAFESTGKITTILFDKTGTLTKGEFGVTRFDATDGSHKKEDVIRMAGSLERNSEHPIATGVLNKLKELNLEVLEAKNYTNITGQGITATVDGEKVSVVSPGYLKEENITLPDVDFSDESETVVFVLKEDKIIGYIALSDEIRESSHEAIKVLKQKGIKVIMVTGDNEKVAKAVSSSLGLDGYHAEALPEDKQIIIKDMQADGEFVAMTGDGVNDAPALAQADVGIAVGSGTDVAAETADIILVNSDPKDIAALILFGDATHKKMMQNLWWASGYNIIAVPAAAGILAPIGIILSPAVGAGLMSLSTVIVAFNAQLLRRKMKSSK